jgi:hypothetical protein
MSSSKQHEMNIVVDGRAYGVEVTRNVSLPPDAPRLAVVSRQETRTASELVQVCIDAIQYFTPEPHELWVVDNNSPMENIEWLKNRQGINLALNRTEPLPREHRANNSESGLPDQLERDSYANALGLELVIRLVASDTKYFMSLHMDTMPCKFGWLQFLVSKMNDTIRAAGVRFDKTRTPEGVLHVLGYLVDFQVFRKLGLDYLPELPEFDVGDKVTVELRKAGYEVFACPNTLWQPELVSQIPSDSPLSDFQVDRAFDDEGNVIFLHLGRGVRKSLGIHRTGTMGEEWVRIAREHLMKS